jgi:hypothetical protein
MLMFGCFATQVPLVTLVGASNELPESEELDALYDRFLLRKEVKQVSVAGAGMLCGRFSVGFHSLVCIQAYVLALVMRVSSCCARRSSRCLWQVDFYLICFPLHPDMRVGQASLGGKCIGMRRDRFSVSTCPHMHMHGIQAYALVLVMKEVCCCARRSSRPQLRVGTVM